MEQLELITSNDWTLLIILDACRYDALESRIRYIESRAGVKTSISKVLSRGSCTVEWFYKTFVEPNIVLDDVVYISANPLIRNGYVKDLYEYDPRKHFHRIIDTWDWGYKVINGVRTVDPWRVLADFVRYRLVYSDKRFILHFIQPHAPYPFPECSYLFINPEREIDFKLWDSLRKGVLAREKAYQWYMRNLDLALEVVVEIVKRFKKKYNIVITSDHAECFGEDGLYGHPCFNNSVFLRTVPWLVITD